jgi:hypothetical protein
MRDRAFFGVCIGILMLASFCSGLYVGAGLMVLQ